MTPFLVHQLLERSAQASPDATALIDPKVRLTYAELFQESTRVATALADLGVGPGDRVALSMEKSARAVASAYGIMMRGAAYVPVDPSMPRARAELILASTTARVVVTTADKLALFAEARSAAPELSRALVTSSRESMAAAAASLDSAALDDYQPDARARHDVTDGYLAYVLHTSGSTGKPKGVALTHRNCLAFVEPATARFAIGPKDVLACQAPLHFDLSVFDLYCAALAGAAVVVMPEYFSAFPKKMSQAIAKHGVTIWNSVVSALALLADKGDLGGVDRDSLRAVIFSGERMPIPLLRRLRELMPRAGLYNVYGQTEANSSCVHEVAEIPADDGAALPLGKTLPNFEVFLLDQDNRVMLEPESAGELCVAAATVASGAYYRDPERSADKFVIDPRVPESKLLVYRTGDLVRREASGDLYFAGRRDDMIKTRGFRVELGEVQAALDRIAGILESAVVAVPHPAITNELVAFLTLEAQSDLTRADIEARLATALPAYMVPRIEIGTDLPRTSTGKIDKSALVARVLEGRGAQP